MTSIRGTKLGKLKGILFDLHGTLIHLTEENKDRLRVGYETLASAHSDIPFGRFRDVRLSWRFRIWLQ